MDRTDLTLFQSSTKDFLKKGKSVLVVAPTGLGKTLAATADLEENKTKLVYGVPLRALGTTIRNSISELRRDGQPIRAVIHNGDTQESLLFGEEAVVTTYDQIVCGIPGLPLSLPLKAGHAVAAALIMSRLVLDEAHLAWGISREALSILLAIVQFRQRFRLQTILQTATLPIAVAEVLKDRLQLDELIFLGQGVFAKDEGLSLREQNRKVSISPLALKTEGRGEKKTLSFQELDRKLQGAGKRIYFGNTVGRLQETYDRLTKAGVNPGEITVLHNRMPRSWRERAEKQTWERFGKASADGDWLLLTNQVAEAGLDISARLVISDPAPVDTLVQRSGRCARWFREGETRGEFMVLNAPNKLERERLAAPYRVEFVNAALDLLPKGQLCWAHECDWVSAAWGGDPKKALQAVQEALDRATFALNLFDRAAQERSPGMIAGEFRRILQIEVAVEDAAAPRDLQQLLDRRLYPETSSVSLGRGWSLLGRARRDARIIRYDEGRLGIDTDNSLRLGDILVVPSTMAYLHEAKGLCFAENGEIPESASVKKSSDWKSLAGKLGEQVPSESGRGQTLFEHVEGVVGRTRRRLTDARGAYRTALVKILRALEPETDAERLADLISQVALVGAAFHDFGKAGKKWQEKAREIDPNAPEGLIGRTCKAQSHIKLPPHTPPGFRAVIKTCELLLGELGLAQEHLVHVIALAAARHHSSLTNPSTVDYTFDPDPRARDFVGRILQEIGATPAVIERSDEIVEAAAQKPTRETVPLVLPNDDLFPIYALVGRAILISDREDAAGGKDLEEW